MKWFKVYQVASIQKASEVMFDFGNLDWWCLLAQHLCAGYHLFFPKVDWNPLRMGCRERRLSFASYFSSKVRVLQPTSNNAPQHGVLSQIARKLHQVWQQPESKSGYKTRKDSNIDLLRRIRICFGFLDLWRLLFIYRCAYHATWNRS